MEESQIKASFEFDSALCFPTNEFASNGEPICRDVRAIQLQRVNTLLGDLQIRTDFIESYEKIKSYVANSSTNQKYNKQLFATHQPT